MFASCNSLPGAAPKSPVGAGGDVARQVAAILAPSTEIVDQPFEDLLSALDLATTYGVQATEILDQIRRTRAAVAAEHKSSSARGRWGLASLARSVGTFSIPQFAIRFGESLDQLTKGGGTLQVPNRPYSNQETASKSFTTTTLSVAESYTGVGSRVTATVTWSYSTITIETATGKTLVHLTDDRTLVGGIDVCPDAGGLVPATLDVTSAIVAQIPSGTTTRRSTGNSSFQGTVDDQAVLRSVAQRSRNEATTQSASGSGGYSADQSATWTPRDSSGDYFGGNLDVGSAGDSVVATGAASAADAARAAGWDFALGGYALSPAYKAAQDLWRRGRCVMVTAPDYGAETPINTLAQQEPQHDEAVDPASETRFGVSLKHRFGGALSAPAVASLSSGAKSVAPSRLDGGSGTLTYKAPDEDDQKASVLLKSTSKRGIGTLVLTFHTGGALTLTITGEVTGNSSGIGTVRIRDTVKMGPLELKRSFGDYWEATGPWTAETSSVTVAAGATDTCTGNDSGTVTLMATIETRGGSKVWVIDPLQSAFDGGKGSATCVSSLGDQTLRGVTIPGTRTHETNGEAGEIFFGILDAFTIPAEGGTVRVRGARDSWTSGGTVTATKK